MPAWLSALLALIAKVAEGLFTSWLTRKDTRAAAQSEVIAASLQEAHDAQQSLADDAAVPRSRDDAARRLRDGTF